MLTKITILPVLSREEIRKTTLLAYEIWSEYYPTIIGQAQVDYMLENFQSEKAILQQIDEGFHYFLIQGQDQLIGYFGIVPDYKTKELFISKFYVKLAFRNQGAGKQALRFIESFAKARHLTKISLMVCKKNTLSRKAYEKMGFKNVGDIYKAIGGGFFMDDFRMEKIIN